MNRYILIHRLTGPAVLLLLGIVALLSEAGVVRWSIFIPLLLILLGLLKLAERAALAGCDYPGAGPQGPGAATYSATPYGTSPYEQPGGAAPSAPQPPHDFGKDAGEGKL